MATPKNQVSKIEQNESRQSNVAKQNFNFRFFWGCDKDDIHIEDCDEGDDYSIDDEEE